MPRVPVGLALLGAVVSASCGSPQGGGPIDARPSVDAGYVASSLIPPPTDGFQLAMDEFTVQPGTEAYMCQVFQIPAGAKDVGAWEFRMALGSHHLLLFGFDAGLVTTRRAFPCDGGGIPGINSIMSGTQTPSSTIAYPPGIAFAITPGAYILMQAHYVNAGDAPITAQVNVNVHLVDPSTVTANAGTLFFDPTRLSIPPGAGQKLTFQVKAPQNLQVLVAAGHMHSHGIDFNAQVNPASGSAPVPLFDQTSWEEPSLNYYSPAITVSAGDVFQWSCTWNNSTGSTIVYGNSAIKNEMCIFYATFYPVIGGQNTLFADPAAL